MSGIVDLHFHDLHHEAASMLFDRGRTIPQVAQVTGHRTWRVLQRYTHLRGPQVVDKYAGWAWLLIELTESVSVYPHGKAPRSPPRHCAVSVKWG